MIDDDLSKVKVRAWNNQGVPITSCVGYCRYHKYYLTEKQLKRKGCLKKQCKRLLRLDKNPFWKKREEIKNARKQKTIRKRK